MAGLMIFHIFVLYICGIPAADIRYFAGLELVFFVVSAVFCGIRYWYRLRTVKRQIRDYMQGMQTLSDTEDALEEVYMDALEQLQNKRQEEKGAYRNQQREMEEYYALWVHQIKTPISAMRLLLQREEQKQTDPDETAGMEKSVLYDMQQELFWINQYINMALQYQRMNSGMNDLVLEMVSADQVVRTAIRRFAPIMIRKKIAIHYEECREMVLSDEKWLEFVVEQILSNAIKYSGENRAVTIQINRNEADNTCELVISDQGIGIRKEDLPRIFEKGYTGYNGRADKTSTGIGRIPVNGSIILDTNGKCNTSLASVFCGNGNDISQCIAIFIYGLLDIVNRIVISCICNHFVCGIRIILLLVEPRGICKHCLIRFFFGLLVGFVNRSLCNSIYSS